VLIPALLLGGILDWIGMRLAGTETIYTGHSGMHFLTVNVHSTLTLPVLAENVLFLQDTAPLGTRGHVFPGFGSNGLLWSLSCEFWYYIAFPLLILLASSGQRWRVRMLCGLGLAALVLVVGDFTILWLAIPWLTGVFIACLPPPHAPGPWMRGTVVGVALTVFGAGFKFDELHPIYADPVLGLAVAFLIWVLLYCSPASVPSWYGKLAQRAAHSSYTIYLFHLPMLVFLKASLHLPFFVPGWYSCLVAGGLLLVIFLYTQLIYEVFEKHTDEVRSWLRCNPLFSGSIGINRMAGGANLRGPERKL
jgi:peptidoglycan/LPS O-acetylase OafA/YrhL